MPPFNNEKLTSLDYQLLEKKYGQGTGLETILKKIDDDYPVQYAIGDVDFLGYRIEVDERVLIPRFETELLVLKLKERIEKEYADRKIRILDLCTGSGCIAIALKKLFPESEVFAVDKSTDALNVAQKNAHINAVEVIFLERDVLKAIDIDKKFDIVVSNPPYVKRDEVVSKNTKFEPKIALYPGEDDVIFYRKILEQAHEIVDKKGLIAFEIGSEQGSTVKAISQKLFLNASVTIEKDYAEFDRFVFIEGGFE